MAFPKTCSKTGQEESAKRRGHSFAGEANFFPVEVPDSQGQKRHEF